MITKTGVFALALGLAATTAAQLIITIDPKNYPPLDVTPPSNATWNAKFNVNVPNIPLAGPNGTKNLDWSKDVTTCKGTKLYAQTFDDGPSPYTPPILDTFRKLNMTTTFFVIGSRAISYPDTLLREYQAGHQIAVHTWSHPHLTSLTNEEIISEVVWTAKAIREVLGVTPTYFRPPYGDIDDRVRTIIRNMGFTIVLWDVDPSDALGTTNVTAVITASMVNTTSSHISLEHDLYPGTAIQAPPTSEAIVASGYTIQRVDQCIGAKTPSYSDAMWSGLYTFPNLTFDSSKSSAYGIMGVDTKFIMLAAGIGFTTAALIIGALSM